MAGKTYGWTAFGTLPQEPAGATGPPELADVRRLGLPDEAGLRALLDLYRGRLVVSDTHLDTMATQTEGVTASFLKELLRRAAVVAADDGARDGAAAIDVADAHLDAALEELNATRNAMTRSLLGGGRVSPEVAVGMGLSTISMDDDEDEW